MTTDGAGCILFLDFDGVTHPDPCDAGQHFTRLPLIEEVLRPYPACKIVISSSWRAVHPLDEMRTFFADDMRPRVIGVTPEYGGPGGNDRWDVAVVTSASGNASGGCAPASVWLPPHRRAGAPVDRDRRPRALVPPGLRQFAADRCPHWLWPGGRAAAG